MQVPAHFEYERATSVQHALALLAKYGPESRVLAGGHSLIPMMKLRPAPPETPLDLNHPPQPAQLTRQDRQPPNWGPAQHPPARRSAGAGLWLDGDTITEAGIGLAAVGAAHFSAAEAEDFLRGAPATDESFVAAGRIAAEHCSPVSDQRGPADYKRHLAAELTVRALRRALGRAPARRGEA